MKFVRFRKKGEAPELKGVYEGVCIRRIFGSFFGSFSLTDEKYAIDEIEFIPVLYPRTIYCMGKLPYIKSPSSLSASDTLIVRHNPLFCMPRLVGVVKDKGRFLGSALMLDFFPQDIGAAASTDGYSVIGALHYGVIEDKDCIFMGQKGELRARQMNDTLNELSALMTLVAGDFICLPFFETAFEVAKGPILLSVGEEQLSVTKVLSL